MATSWNNFIDWPLGVGELYSTVTNVGTTLVMVDNDVANYPAVPFLGVIEYEHVLVTAKASVASRTNLTVTRAQNGTTAVQHLAGATFTVDLVNSHITAMRTAINALESGGVVDALAVGGGYGSTGCTISGAGNISANGTLIIDGASTLTGLVTATAGLTANAAIRAQSGSQAGCLFLGADINGSTLTNITQKIARIVFKHYTTSEEDIAILLGDSSSGYTAISWGGGSSAFNCPTIQDFYAGATTTTVAGTGMMRLTTAGVRIGSIVTATATLDVTGTALISSTLGVTGIITSNGGITMGDAKNIIFNTTTGSIVGTAVGQKFALWGKTPIVQPASASQAVTVMGNTNNEIGALTFTNPPTDVEVIALKDKCEELADDVRNLHTLVHAMRTAMVDFGSMKGAA